MGHVSCLLERLVLFNDCYQNGAEEMNVIPMHPQCSGSTCFLSASVKLGAFS